MSGVTSAVQRQRLSLVFRAPSDHRSLSPHRFFLNTLSPPWAECYKAVIQLAGSQVPGLEALQRADFMTFCLCVPDCVRAATDHAMDQRGDSHRLECLGVSSGSRSSSITNRHLIALPGRAAALRLLSWLHFSG